MFWCVGNKTPTVKSLLKKIEERGKKNFPESQPKDSTPKLNTSTLIPPLPSWYPHCPFSHYTHCIECKNSLVAEELLLPEDFCAANFTILKNKGGLIFVTIPMFLSFRTIEAVIAQHFANEKHVYITNTFRLCIKAISKSSIHPLFCEKHRKDSLPVLIREYVHIRFFFEQKRYNDFSFSKSNT